MIRYLFLGIGALLVWTTSSSGSPSETAETFDRLRAEALHLDGTVTAIEEREVTQRGRRGRSSTHTEYCPVVTYQRPDVDHPTDFLEHDDCTREPDEAYVVGDQVTVLYDADELYGEHIDSDAVRDSLSSSESSFRWSVWLGWGLVVLSSATILWGWYLRIRGRLSHQAGGRP